MGVIADRNSHGIGLGGISLTVAVMILASVVKFANIMLGVITTLA